MGLCALTLPTGVPSCGIMLMAAPTWKKRLLRLGAAAEAALLCLKATNCDKAAPLFLDAGRIGFGSLRTNGAKMIPN